MVLRPSAALVVVSSFVAHVTAQNPDTTTNTTNGNTTTIEYFDASEDPSKLKVKKISKQKTEKSTTF